jgi:hypothetical protein
MSMSCPRVPRVPRVIVSYQRRIVEGSGTFAVPAANDRNSTVRLFPVPVMPLSDAQDRGDGTRELWNSNSPDLWQKVLNRYGTIVKPSHIAPEKEIDELDAETVRTMNLKVWFEFLAGKILPLEIHRAEQVWLDQQNTKELCGEQRASCSPRD